MWLWIDFGAIQTLGTISGLWFQWLLPLFSGEDSG